MNSKRDRNSRHGSPQRRAASADPNPVPASQHGKYAHLPEPVRLEDTITSKDIDTNHEEISDDRREREWMLRNAGGIG